MTGSDVDLRGQPYMEIFAAAHVGDTLSARIPGL
jgi:hypothetical protein